VRPAPAADFAEAVLQIVASIPPGQVMTYGDVAAVLGSRAARAVGNVMSWYGSDVPWWRVIRASGHPAAGHEDRAFTHFVAEGTPLITSPEGYRVNLRLARHTPA
jgi:alkylated DNA nucleotide flippase Atl1